MARMGAAAVCVVALATSCIGSITREEFDERVRERGGGVGADLPVRALDAVEEDLGVEELELLALHVTPSEVTLQVRVPDAPENVDSYTYGSSGLYGGRGLRGPEPVNVGSKDLTVEDRAFPAGEAGVERLDAMVDEAMSKAGLEGGYATRADVRRSPALGVVVQVTVTDDRHTAVATFDAGGDLKEVETS